MADGDERFSNKNPPNSSDDEELPNSKDKCRIKPDLGLANVEHNNKGGGQIDDQHIAPKLSNISRKEENPFSFRHFLKRDLSLPGNSTYESTGAKSKVHAKTVQHSPTKLDIQTDNRSEETPEAKDNNSNTHEITNNSSASSVELPFSTVENTESKHNLYDETVDIPFYNRVNVSSDALGLPSLPDFVQDHILVEQAYLNANTPLSVDLDNLPDFTFNTNYNQASTSSQGCGLRRNNVTFGNDRDYDFGLGCPSTSRCSMPCSSQSVPLDLPLADQAVASHYDSNNHSIPLDLHSHLNLDLTESVNANRRNVSPIRSFPLDLPPNAGNSGNESLRLPDFLPVHSGGRQSPDSHQINDNRELERLNNELDCIRSELFSERIRANRLESELASSQSVEEALRQELRLSRNVENDLRKQLQEAKKTDTSYTASLATSVNQVETNLQTTLVTQQEAQAPAVSKTNVQQNRATEADLNAAKYKAQVKKLKEDLGIKEAEIQDMKSRQHGVSRDLQAATVAAEISLKNLLTGLEQLKVMSKTLDPP